MEGMSPAQQRRILNGFLAECSQLRELEAKLGRFNIFCVLRFEEGEIRHSKNITKGSNLLLTSQARSRCVSVSCLGVTLAMIGFLRSIYLAG